MNDTSTLTGVYSNTGFDMIQLLSRLISRPNPQIQLGPIDFSCSFVVSDANQLDCPVVYCSPAFETLTGYTNQEIVGKNCRFLQSPDGQVICGAKRRHTDNQAVYYLKSKINQGMEHQASIINYRKGGQPFVNLVTVIPLFDANNIIEYFVGLQVDLVEQPNSILEKMKDGTYIINYHQTPSVPKPISSNNPLALPSTNNEYFQEIPAFMESCTIDPAVSSTDDWNKLLISNCTDFIYVISLKGTFLYASPSSSTMLEYTPDELSDTNLSSICHPSDIIPVMREIKDTKTDINLIFRIRRKYSGYMWFESRGSLHMDQSKSRKCLILAGRERPVYDLPLKPLETSGYWMKLSNYGLILHVTESCKDMVGFTAQSLMGESIYQYTESTTEITHALQTAKQGQTITTNVSLMTSKGTYTSLFCTFYPQNGFILLQVSPSPGTTSSGVKQAHAVNLFEELDTTRSTNWQYELYQLKQQNRKLKEQLEQHTVKRKKRKVNDVHKMCAFCQRQDSPEWRKGPNGPKELCNACGLKYAKSLLIKS